jgi:hypothetical protein
LADLRERLLCIFTPSPGSIIATPMYWVGEDDPAALGKVDPDQCGERRRCDLNFRLMSRGPVFPIEVHFFG